MPLFIAWSSSEEMRGREKPATTVLRKTTEEAKKCKEAPPLMLI